MNSDESEAERNMRIARSVLDEETALDMARTFIKLTKVVTMTKKTQKTNTKITSEMVKAMTINSRLPSKACLILGALLTS